MDVYDYDWKVMCFFLIYCIVGLVMCLEIGEVMSVVFWFFVVVMLLDLIRWKE